MHNSNFLKNKSYYMNFRLLCLYNLHKFGLSNIHYDSRDFFTSFVEKPEKNMCHFFQIDENKAKYIENLRKAVAIKSVSAWPETRDEIGKMMKVGFFNSFFFSKKLISQMLCSTFAKHSVKIYWLNYFSVSFLEHTVLKKTFHVLHLRVISLS